MIHTGQALVDLVIGVPMLPARGGNVMAGSAQRFAGGAVNVLIAAARSGAPAVHAGAHGTGPNGDLVRTSLASAGVALSAPAVLERDTGVCVVLVEPTGERTFVTTLGAERELSVAGLTASAPVPGDIVCLTGYTLLEPTREPLLTWLEGVAEGVVVLLDPGEAFAGVAAPLQQEVLARVGIWTSNAAEAAELTGEATPEACVAAMAERLPGALVVVRDGPRGCYLGGRGVAPRHVPGYPQRAVDTNGAGDAHVGVMVAGLAAGLDPVAAATRANAAGAIKVTRRGPATAPMSSEIDAFLAAHAPGRPGG